MRVELRTIDSEPPDATYAGTYSETNNLHGLYLHTAVWFIGVWYVVA